MENTKTVLIFSAATGYQSHRFFEAARKLGLVPVMVTDHCKVLDGPWGNDSIALRLEDPAGSAERVARMAPNAAAVVAAGDRPLSVAARVAALLGLRFHTLDAVDACRNKYRAREILHATGLPVPAYFRVPAASDPHEIASRAHFPCVLKPLGLSGSRGVIRANNSDEFITAFLRIRSILGLPEILRMQDEADHFIQVEDYIPGREFAIEGIVRRGSFHCFAVFDKPDPLEGPYFEETIYVTPSRAPVVEQDQMCAAVARGAVALGLTDGPLHAELRWNERGAWLLEIAARPIGGLCAQALEFEGGQSLEEVLLRAALGEDEAIPPLKAEASGVLMIPIPKSGVFQGVSGVESAVATQNITAVHITAVEGQILWQLPEGSSYLGFIFARAATPEQAELALRTAHQKLAFKIAQGLPLANLIGVQ